MTRARADAILGFLATGRIQFVAPQGAEPAAVAAERQVVDARIREHQANLAALTARRSGAVSAAMTSAEKPDGIASQPLMQPLPAARRAFSAFAM